MASPDEDPLSALVARIAAGETIDRSALPRDFAEQPAVRRLLGFARVAQALACNASVTAADAPAPDRIGPWKLLRLLGSGGMGDVWLGERDDGAVEHRVAIKRVRGASASFTARLDSERRILARLSHPNIARFIDAGVDSSGAPWLALDYIEGDTLNAWCARARPTLGQRLRLFLAICAAVEHAHRHLVVHRDLKPANVLVDSSGVPHLLDFGVAKLLDGSGGELTASALTPAYAAPEQLRGGEVSTATDVYALGLLLFRLLAGELPPTRRDAGVAQVLARLDEEETQQPSATARRQAGQLPYAATLLEGDLDAIVSKAIRALPEARYGSVAELAADVRRHLESRPVSARAPTRAYLFARWVRRNALGVGLGTAAMLALVVGAGLALWQAQRAEREAERAAQQAQRAQRSAEFVLSVFQQADVLRRDARGTITIDEAFEDALGRIDREFSDDPMVAADLNDNFAELLASKGRFDEADARLRQALALAEQAHGPDSPVVAETLINLAEVASAQGRALDGKAWIERAVAILEPRAEEDPEQFGNALMSLANLRSHEARHDEALTLLGRVVSIYQDLGRPDDPDLAVAEFNFGAQLYVMDRWAEAQPHIDRAIAITAAANGEASAGLLPLLDFSMTNLDHLGRHAEAEAAASRMLSIAQSSFEGPHRLVGNGLAEVGYHRLRAGDIAPAVAQLETAIAMLAGLETPQELLAWRYLVLGMAAQARWTDVATRAAQAKARCAHHGVPDTWLCIEIEALAAQAESVIGDAGSALASSDALLARIAAKEIGGDAVAQTRIARALALDRLGDAEAASAEWRLARETVHGRYGDAHRDVLRLDELIARRAASEEV